MFYICNGNNNTGYSTTPTCTNPVVTTPIAVGIGSAGFKRSKLNAARKGRNNIV
jgi:hypothetical protein